MAELISKNDILAQLCNQILTFRSLFISKDISMLNNWMKDTLALGKSQLNTLSEG